MHACTYIHILYPSQLHFLKLVSVSMKMYREKNENTQIKLYHEDLCEEVRNMKSTNMDVFFAFVYLYFVWISIGRIYPNDIFIIRKFKARWEIKLTYTNKRPTACGCTPGFSWFIHKDQNWQLNTKHHYQKEMMAEGPKEGRKGRREEGRKKDPTVLSISNSFYIWKAKDLFTTSHMELQ